MPLRLLSTHERISFQSFITPEAVPGGYAILSHVWRDNEPSFEGISLLADRGATFDDPGVDSKIRQCRRLAKDLNLLWFWSDAPCIDQRNNTELSEAISSMYQWYEKATICIAHLPDVPGDTIIRHPDSVFRNSIYFQRRWTLQELIAPRRVIFVAEDWTVLGEKSELADPLEEITGIDTDVLRFHLRVSDVNVARRLSWASDARKTRRVEDEAYCLMGLFNIHMNIRYGEGHKAFERLQKKILKADCDHTLLAWGGAKAIRIPSGRMHKPESSPHVTTLFAPSPAAFSGSRSLPFICIKEFVASMEKWGTVVDGDSELLPRFALSDHYGLECHLPIFRISPSLLAAVLACKDKSGSLLALPLQAQGLGKLAVYSICCEVQPSSSGVGLDSPTTRLLRISYEDLGMVPHDATAATRPVSGHQTAGCAPTIYFTHFHILTDPSSRSTRIFPPHSPIVPSSRWAGTLSRSLFAGGLSRPGDQIREVERPSRGPRYPVIILRAARWLCSVAGEFMGYVRYFLA
ncbi:hypothetical protein C8Q78DRAFT_1153416 [Trametes maxima]|nr:hypothetical protein C8Q78DRAFT_1153416 [Trametes maxima]